MKRTTVIAGAAALLLLAGCNDDKKSAAAPAGDAAPASLMPTKAADAGAQPDAAAKPAADAVALIDGEPVSALSFAIFVAEHGVNPSTLKENMQTYANTLRDFLTLEVLKRAALAENLELQPQVSGELEYARTKVLSSAALRAQIVRSLPDNDALKAEYDKDLAENKNMEYKARHILVEEEQTARDLITALDGGADFAELAKEKSTGPSGPRGGDLGWFSPKQMVAQFSEATAALEPGHYSKTPVQTRFGWHVILLEDRREGEPVPFDQFKQARIQDVQRKVASQYIESLLAKHEIRVPEAVGREAQGLGMAKQPAAAPEGAAAPAPAAGQ
ncbi:MAG: peptidylprolyl isomerase [Chromatiales bacterium]|nr:peptidylprolyl isomerase [Chromatiales bacterium]